MTQVTVSAVADIDRELGFECDRVFTMPNIESLDQLAYFFGEVTRGMGFSYVDDVVLVTDEGKEFSSYDFTGVKSN